jgi:uncharacterized membrane protein
MITSPPGWGLQILNRTYRSATVRPAVGAASPPSVRDIGLADLRWALQRGWQDFAASRTDVIFLCVFYPVVGLLLARFASGSNALPLVFPLGSGFALLGPLAAVGLNEMSRRRSQNLPAGWASAFQVLRSPSIFAIAVLGFVLLGLFLFWLTAAHVLYAVTLGPEPPASIGTFAHDMLFTGPGHVMAIAGTGIGFCFAVVAMTISTVSFPLLLDRPVSLETAVTTSFGVVKRNPVTMAAWGAIIAAGLVIGSVPALLGLVVVLPVLGHATWHLYTRAVSRPE